MRVAGGMQRNGHQTKRDLCPRPVDLIACYRRVQGSHRSNIVYDPNDFGPFLITRHFVGSAYSLPNGILTRPKSLSEGPINNGDLRRIRPIHIAEIPALKHPNPYALKKPVLARSKNA